MKTIFIYILKEPDTGEIRYVGQSDNPLHRIVAHTTTKDKGHRGNWIRGLRKAGLKPVMEIIDEVPTDLWESAEMGYIHFYRVAGCDLVNETLGGDGTLGWKPSLEWRTNRSNRLKGGVGFFKGRRHSKTSKEKISDAMSGSKNPFYGKTHSKETREKISSAHLGKALTSEHKVNIGKATKGKPKSEETRSRMRAAWVLRKAAHV